MFAVIFKAKVKSFDEEYFATASKLRDLALSQYACLDFIANTEGQQEIAISYWKNEADILAWKQDAFHLQAQAKGKSKWYEEYSVEIVEVVRRYESVRES